ncbi:MAG TPA: hypothetical protein VJA21_10310, partial [Verrucomicrobiae bacterium]
KVFDKKVPLAIGAAWRAPDGQVALALASIGEAPLPVRLTIPAQEYGLSASGKIVRRDHKSRKQIGALTSPVTSLQCELPPRGAWILEFGTP